MKYKPRVIKMVIAWEGVPIFDESAITIEIVDEAAGEFIEIKMAEMAEPLRIEPAEWPAIRDTIDKMVSECRD